MGRLYYVERQHETSETSDRLEAARIAAEWVRRGYQVETVVVDTTKESVEVVDTADVVPTDVSALPLTELTTATRSI
jgi:hypothetical protein